jgi:hypothetical protein
MKRLPSTVRNHLVACAIKAGKDRKLFNELVGDTYRMVGEGSFRCVYDTGEFVIKLRRHEPWSENGFPMKRINSSNRDEAAGYKQLCRENPLFAPMVLKPTRIKLPNGHDVVYMSKVDLVWGDVESDEQKDLKTAYPKLANLLQAIVITFMDAHDFNIGIKDGKPYLIDFNMTKLWNLDANEMEFIKNTLYPLKAMEAAA